jgi:hypothetical protein
MLKKSVQLAIDSAVAVDALYSPVDDVAELAMLVHNRPSLAKVVAVDEAAPPKAPEADTPYDWFE